jgi:hypothetical protein
VKINYSDVLRLVTDSLPPPSKATAGVAAKPAIDSIKQVPKSRNQAVPVSVTQQIKPIKIKPIIRPIIKPVIKILH